MPAACASPRPLIPVSTRNRLMSSPIARVSSSVRRAAATSIRVRGCLIPGIWRSWTPRLTCHLARCGYGRRLDRTRVVAATGRPAAAHGHGSVVVSTGRGSRRPPGRPAAARRTTLPHDTAAPLRTIGDRSSRTSATHPCWTRARTIVYSRHLIYLNARKEPLGPWARRIGPVSSPPSRSALTAAACTFPCPIPPRYPFLRSSSR